MNQLRFTSLPVIYRSNASRTDALEVEFERKRALVIDDDQDTLSLVAAVLCPGGFYVYPAFDGAEGLERFAQVRPDVVILDLLMPRVDGWAVLCKLRQQCRVPVILLTAVADSASRHRGRLEGAADVIAKPFIPRDLAARVAAVLHDAPRPVQAISGG